MLASSRIGIGLHVVRRAAPGVAAEGCAEAELIGVVEAERAGREFLERFVAAADVGVDRVDLLARLPGAK